MSEADWNQDRWLADEIETQRYNLHVAGQQAEQYEYEMSRQQSVEVVKAAINVLSEVRRSAVQRDGVWLRNDAQLARVIDNLTNLVIPCLQP